MAKVFKMRVKTSYGSVPKGYEFQVVSEHSYSTPMESEVRKTLIALGFADAASHDWSPGGKVEVIK